MNIRPRRHLKFAVSALMAVAFVLSLAGPSHAQRVLDDLPRGPKVGDNMVPILQAPDQTGHMRDFRSLARDKGLILLFSRSFDW